MSRIAFFAQLPFHAPILQPIHDALPAGVERILSADRRAVARFRPEVLAMASHAHLEYFRHHVPGAALVNVRHGLIGKRLIERLPGRRSARTFDAVCVGDGTAVATYEREGGRPGAFWPTGYPQLDPLFRRDPPPALGLDPARPTVLYAPTWNLGLTSAEILGERLVALIRAGAPGANVVIKPHPVIGAWRPRWMARWERLAAEPGVWLVRETDADVTRYMLAADLLVSDASSAVFEFLALDRPIVLVTNPRHRADPAFDPSDITWRWRDVGEEVDDVEALPRAVARALADSPVRRARRRQYAQALFGPLTDGRNHARVAERLVAEAARVAAAGPPAVAAGGPPLIWLWHDARIRLAMNPRVRRAVYAPLEPVRLWVRGRRLAVRRPPRHAAGARTP
jgi:hypothetical protein